MQLFRDCPVNCKETDFYQVKSIQAFFDKKLELIKQIENFLSKCTELDSKDAKSHLNLFMIHTLFKKDYEIAKQHYDRALEIDPAIKNFHVEKSLSNFRKR